jgi:hypothetical protein
MRRGPQEEAVVRKVTLLAAGLLLSLTACSGSGNDASTVTPPPNNGTVAPTTRGDVCDDPTGDLGTDAKVAAGTLSEPAGIDLVRAEAELTDTSLKVTYRTAGPVNLVEEPLFLMEQGVPGQDVSFELRASPLGPGTPWTLRLITFRAGQEQSPITLPTPITVSGDTVSYEVSRRDLPPVATLIWQFGSTAGNPSDPDVTVVFDDCSSLSKSVPTTAPGSTAPTATSPATTAPPPVAFGEEQTAADTGMRVTVYAVQVPVTPDRPLIVPPDEGNQVGVVDLQVCAGGESAEANIADLKVKTSDNRQWSTWFERQTVTEPAFPAAQIVPAGECVRGWVPFQIPTGASVAQVLYDPTGRGRGPFLVWKPA